MKHADTTEAPEKTLEQILVEEAAELLSYPIDGDIFNHRLTGDNYAIALVELIVRVTGGDTNSTTDRYHVLDAINAEVLRNSSFASDYDMGQYRRGNP